MIFKHICKKANKYLAKIEVDGKDKWFTVTQAVYNFATKNFEEGSEVDVQYTTKNGQYFATKIMTAGSGEEKVEEVPEETIDYVCEDCGAELKNGKYKKCYTCNKKNPSKRKTSASQDAPSCSDCGKELKDNKYEKCYSCNQKNPSKKETGTYKKSPEVQESIKRQAIGHMTSRSLIALTGQVDVNNIEEIAESLYKLYVKLVG